MNTNEAAKTVSESLNGDAGAWIVAGNYTHRIAPPKIKVMCRAIPHFSQVEASENNGVTESPLFKDTQKNASAITRGLAVLIVGDKPFWRLRAFIVARSLRSASWVELYYALEIAGGLMQGRDFFACAVLAKSVAETAAHQK